MTYRVEQAAKQAAKALRTGPDMACSAWEAMPAEEREVLLNTVELMKMGHISLARKSLDHYAVVRYRNSRKAMRDAIRDGKARTLVGARLPRETAQRVREAAQDTGRSVYRFVADAVERELTRSRDSTAGGGDSTGSRGAGAYR